MHVGTGPTMHIGAEAATSFSRLVLKLGCMLSIPYVELGRVAPSGSHVCDRTTAINVNKTNYILTSTTSVPTDDAAAQD